MVHEKDQCYQHYFTDVSRSGTKPETFPAAIIATVLTACRRYLGADRLHLCVSARRMEVQILLHFDFNPAQLYFWYPGIRCILCVSGFELLLLCLSYSH